MLPNTKFLALLACLMMSPATVFSRDEHTETLPATHGMMTFLYYENHAEAVDFYRNTLGFREILDDGWIVIVEAAPGSRIALANSTEGALKPVKDKGALIAVETEELEDWFERLKAKGLEFISGWEEGDYVQQFRVYDPGGYIVEFVRWHPRIKEKFKNI